APGGLAHFSGLAVALAQRLLPRAAHTGLAAFAALREARRCQSGNREPQRQRGSPVLVPTDHHSISFQCAPRAEATHAGANRWPHRLCIAASLPAATRGNVYKTVMPRARRVECCVAALGTGLPCLRLWNPRARKPYEMVM